MDDPQRDEPPSTPAGTPEPEDDPVVRELERLCAGARARSGGEQFFVLLPLGSEAEVLAFLRTVPTGTLPAEVPHLARAWRAAHPVSLPPADEDRA